MLGLGFVFFIFRLIASLMLGLAIFLGFLSFILVGNVRDKLLTSEFYTESLAENAVYDRIYDEVLLDPEFEDTTQDLLGDVDVPREDIVGVTREIIEPTYLQEEVEGAITGTIDYLNKDAETPEIFIHLGPVLARVKPALLSYTDQRIDALEDVPVKTMDELQAELESLYRTLEEGKIPTQVPFIEDADALVVSYVDQTIEGLTEVPVGTSGELQGDIQDIFSELSGGTLPTSIPSIESIPVGERLRAYDLALETARREGLVPEEALQRIEALEGDIKQELRQADVKGALKVASPELTRPSKEGFLDDVYDRVYSELESEGFSPGALAGLDRESALVKQYLGEGRVKDSLKAGARGLTGPLIDEAIAELRKELDAQDRLDLVKIAAEQNNQTKETFLENLDSSRDVIDLTELGQPAAQLIIGASALLMAAVNFPHLATGLRLPGLTMFFSGLLFLVLGLVLTSQLPDRFDDLLDQNVSGASPIPNSMIFIINDVLTSMATDIAKGFIGPSIGIMVIGIVLLIGSVFMRRLGIPFFSR